jgi:pilus assembly protein Flp/PilA
MALATAWERFSSFLRAKVQSERGASLVEYALLLALIALVCLAAVTFLGTNTSAGISTNASKMFTA